jgi:serine/threonine-protein kinase RsbW
MSESKTIAALKPTTVEVRVPSRMGFEKVAMSTAASVAKLMGFRDDRIEDLKTALAEACINAIEHGNRLNEKLSVGVVLSAGVDALEVKVMDDGKGMNRQPGKQDRPDIDQDARGRRAARHGHVSDSGAGGRSGVGGRHRWQQQLCPAGDPAG